MAGCTADGDKRPASEREGLNNLGEHAGATPEALRANDAHRSDSLASLLAPILLSNPLTRELEDWFQLRHQWMPIYGDTEGLLNNASLAYDFYEKTGDLVKAARVKHAVSRINFMRGNYSKAIEEMQASLNLAQAAGDSISIGWALSGFPSPFLQSGDIETAADYLNRAIQVAEQTGSIELKGITTVINSIYHGTIGKLDTACIIMEEALILVKENKLKGLDVYSNLNYGVLLTYLEKYDAAIAQLNSDYGLDGVSISMANAMLHFNLYEAYLGKEDYQQALSSLEKGCMMSDSLKFGFGQSFCAKSKAEFYEKMQDYELALTYNKAYHIIREQQEGERVQERIRSLETEQRIKEKDWEIERLQTAELDQEAAFRDRRNFLLYLIFGLFMFSLASFAIIQARYREKSAYQSKTIAETKLQVLQSQMNPHFIYNAMTGIQNYILKSEKIEAYSYLGKFADLLRMITKSSRDTSILLKHEVEMIQTYLDLEKLRFREAFVYELVVDEEILGLNPAVPSMMVQPVVENAIIHGLSGLKRQGKLTIAYEKYQQGIKCTVTDNGRGRAAATKIAEQDSNHHLSIASINMSERLKFLREIGYTHARTKVEDLYHDGVPAGTTVYIYLPILTDEKYNL